MPAGSTSGPLTPVVLNCAASLRQVLLLDDDGAEDVAGESLGAGSHVVASEASGTAAHAAKKRKTSS
jgi:hypothetical protein